MHHITRANEGMYQLTEHVCVETSGDVLRLLTLTITRKVTLQEPLMPQLTRFCNGQIHVWTLLSLVGRKSKNTGNARLSTASKCKHAVINKKATF